MRSRTSALRSAAFLVVLAASLLAVAASQAQVPVGDEAVVEVSEVEQILHVGEQLEHERRWGEALVHYEEALRKHPGREELQQRLVFAKLHYEVARRYSDTSFLETLNRLSEREALELYAEVLLKIHAYYVERPDWKELVRRGELALEVAMGEPTFAKQHALDASRQQKEKFLQELRRLLDAHVILSRHEARDTVSVAARLAEQRLPVSSPSVILEFACAAAGSLDDYSAFLTGSQLEEVLSQIEGNFVGLGIELKADDHSLLIVSVIAGGPADKAGIRAGERIVQVDGRPTADRSADAAADMLKGPDGSPVELLVVSAQGTSRKLRLERRRVDVPSVEDASIVDPQLGIGYLRVTSFQKTTGRDVDAALWKLYRQGMRSLIVDVRRNPGGLLKASVEVADKFLSSGSIVSTRGRSSGEDFDYHAHLVGTWRMPLIVLIDGESASAAEIFAGAIRDHHRGTIVGTRSYGKGSVQGIFPLDVANAGIRLTTAKFYAPSGQPISDRGVLPDIVVHTALKPIDVASRNVAAGEADPILNAALQVARQQLSQR